MQQAHRISEMAGQTLNKKLQKFIRKYKPIYLAHLQQPDLTSIAYINLQQIPKLGIFDFEN